MISLHRVSHHYNDLLALDAITFMLQAGEWVIVSGGTGSGKSTLIKLLTLTLPLQSGEITVQSYTYSELRPKQQLAVRRQLGLLLQQNHLLPEKTVAYNVGLPLLIEGYSAIELDTKVERALGLVNLTMKRSAFPHELSASEQRKVAIARAIVHEPSVLFADEPTAELDMEAGHTILKLFQQLKNQGMTILATTHDVALIAGLPCRILRLEQGQLC